MKTSVALCTYNGEKYILEQLQSISAQTFLPNEIVVCDDRSVDGTVRIVEDFAKTAPFSVKIIVNDKNLGFRKNFEKAVSLCSNDIIFLCDQDDIWKAEKIERILESFLSKDGVVYVFTDGIVVDEQKVELASHIITDEYREMYTRNDWFKVFSRPLFPLGCLAAVKRDFAHSVIPFLADHDGWLAACAPIYGEVVMIDEPLIEYRRHGNNTSGAFDSLRKQSKVKKLYASLKNRFGQSYEAYYIYPKEYCEIYRYWLEEICRLEAPVDKGNLQDHIEFLMQILAAKDRAFLFRVKILNKLKKEGLYRRFRSSSNVDFILDIVFMLLNSFKK